ncbi:MAG: hypothetical protein A2Z86_10370 [Candidatus Glassbacteria bacterium GWA2_58_10]|uniref:Uncharacterized protein n=1 Tax=Candidatus Glassbacteria bacterium GWA2_58_10 TaxID=1817865 RepID=A0A1F5YAT0_9BACT|nr:MAG: hypothetical protein A2Z86_10370 [Candidatus Glassbacteria bacterium GWA2_58_10]
MAYLKAFFNFLTQSQLFAILIGFFLGAFGNEYIRQWFFSPEIIIDYRQEKPFVINSRIGFDMEKIYYPYFQFRLSIYNKSKYFKADKHVVMLTGLWNLVNDRYEKEELFEPVRLNSLSYGPETILPKMRVFTPLGRITHVDYQKQFEGYLSGDLDKPQFRFELKDMPRWILSHVAPGKHLFEITVYFDNIPPVSKKFELFWSGRWPESYEEMLKQIVIKAL